MFRAPLIWALLLLLGGLNSAFARDIPPLTARVNDYAQILSSATTSQLETVLAELEATDSTQLAVLTIDSLAGDNLEAFSLRVVEQWQLGRQNLDNGALLLIARDDRQLRIEVGYGLEGTLTDLVAGQIIRDVITPHFRLGNFDQGVIDGVAAMISAVRGQFTAPAGKRTGVDADEDIGGMLTALLFIYLFLGQVFRKHLILAATAGGIISPLFAYFIFGITGLLLVVLTAFGAIGAVIAAAKAGSPAITRIGGGRIGRSGGGGFSGGFGGGFGGGGGGFGGGGASGRW